MKSQASFRGVRIVTRHLIAFCFPDWTENIVVPQRNRAALQRFRFKLKSQNTFRLFENVFGNRAAVETVTVYLIEGNLVRLL